MPAQVSDGGGVVDDCRGDGRARLRHQLPEWLTVETGEGKGDAAGLAQRDDPPPVKVEQLVQLHQVAADGDKRLSDDAPMHQIQHRQKKQGFMRSLAPGSVGPCRAWGAVEGSEMFYDGGKVGHGFMIFVST